MTGRLTAYEHGQKESSNPIFDGTVEDPQPLIAAAEARS
jgi:hypothetical protein